MPKTKLLTDKEKDLKEFIRLTWEVVRRNPEYREDYIRFLQNYDLTPEDVKPKKQDGHSIIPAHPGSQRRGVFDDEKGRFVWEDETLDPQRCNLAYMMARWAFASDPDRPTPQGHSWRSAFISKEWFHKRKETGPIMNQPLQEAQINLQKLPGVLEVDRWPEVWLNDENKRKFQEASRAIMDGWKPQNEQELQEYQEAINPRQWETEDPPQLTITVNLQAPSHLILYALEFLVKVCKADLKIPDGKLDGEHIQKCLGAWDLKQQGLDDNSIADNIMVRKYEVKEATRAFTDEMIAADQGINSDTPYKVKRIGEYIEKAWAMIKSGSVI